jgi:serine/threonine protein kinase
MSMIGKTLGTFTLEAQIGKGGMGEVYRAKDQKLGRDVAGGQIACLAQPS